MAITIVRDLRSQLGPARNQGNRPTCVAFAFSDGHAAARRCAEPLSVEHLYFNAVQRTASRDPSAGVTMPTCGAALAADGQCPEVGWPYLNRSPDLGVWQVPATAKPILRRVTKAEPGAVAAITTELDAGRPIVIALLLGERFYVPDGEGRITPGSGDADTDYHAVLAVGHGLGDSDPYLLVRNSWGAEWGLDGHGWISAAYLGPRLYALAAFPSQETV